MCRICFWSVEALVCSCDCAGRWRSIRGWLGGFWHNLTHETSSSNPQMYIHLTPDTETYSFCVPKHTELRFRACRTACRIVLCAWSSWDAYTLRPVEPCPGARGVKKYVCAFAISPCRLQQSAEHFWWLSSSSACTIDNFDVQCILLGGKLNVSHRVSWAAHNLRLLRIYLISWMKSQTSWGDDKALAFTRRWVDGVLH